MMVMLSRGLITQLLIVISWDKGLDDLQGYEDFSGDICGEEAGYLYSPGPEEYWNIEANNDADHGN